MLTWVLKLVFNLDKGLGVDPNGGWDAEVVRIASYRCRRAYRSRRL